MFRSSSKSIVSFTSTPKYFFKSHINPKSQLKQRLQEVLPKKIEQFKQYRKKYGEFEIGSLTVNDVLNGCVNSPILFYEGSVMNPKTVIFSLKIIINSLSGSLITRIYLPRYKGFSS